MSLLDTIKAARQEAEEAGTLPGAGKGKDTAESEASTEAEVTTTSSATGFSRRSAARAKPTREAASTVHTKASAKDTSKMTKEEKKAAQEERRRDEDLMIDAKRILLDQREDYRRSQRIWWGMLIGGVVLSVLSFVLMQSLQKTEAPSQTVAMISAGSMVVAYILIIGAFIFDMWKIRPMRNEADERITSMSKKRMRQMVEADEKRRAEKKAKK